MFITCLSAEMVDIMAQLDCLISFADSSHNFNFTRSSTQSSHHRRTAAHNLLSIAAATYRPVLTSVNRMRVKQARHPLQELLVDQYIPNDIVLETGAGSSLIKIVTGQNGSGLSSSLAHAIAARASVDPHKPAWLTSRYDLSQASRSTSRWLGCSSTWRKSDALYLHKKVPETTRA